MSEEYQVPLRFTAHYEGECGEAFEIFGMAIPTLKLPCEECEKIHTFKLIYVEHGV